MTLDEFVIYLKSDPDKIIAYFVSKGFNYAESFILLNSIKSTIQLTNQLINFIREEEKNNVY